MTTPRWIPRARTEAPHAGEAPAPHAAREVDGTTDGAPDAR
jgi:hypothetical protein